LHAASTLMFWPLLTLLVPLVESVGHADWLYLPSRVIWSSSVCNFATCHVLWCNTCFLFETPKWLRTTSSSWGNSYLAIYIPCVFSEKFVLGLEVLRPMSFCFRDFFLLLLFFPAETTGLYSRKL
jgi:hypothetical protein